MIIIAAYWLALLPLFLIWGTAVEAILKIRAGHASILQMFGMFALTIAFIIAAFFVPLDENIFIATVLSSGCLAYTLRQRIKANFRVLIGQACHLSRMEKIALFIITFLALYKSAQLPSLIDNETYYIQTIKWLNEYGYVKGLANLHLFLGQQSSWHVLQAGLNLRFVTSSVNDLNGFILILFAWYILWEYRKKSSSGWFTYTLLLLPLLFLFADAPSPDLPVVIFCTIAFYIISHQQEDKYAFLIACILLLFAVYIKITIAPILIMILLYQKNLKRYYILIAGIVVPLGILWLTRNYLVTGHPFYPFVMSELAAPWAVPQEIIEGIHQSSNAYVYNTVSVHFMEKIKNWLFSGSIKSMFNIGVTILFLFAPLLKVVRRRYLKIYIALLVQFIALLFISPQLRFILPSIVFLCAVVACEFFNWIRVRPSYTVVLAVTGVLLLPAIFLPSGIFASLTPMPSTRFPDQRYDRQKLSNMFFYSPINKGFIYFTGDGSLPCVNVKQINYIRQKYGYVPQLGGSDLSSGFISEKVQ